MCGHYTQVTYQHTHTHIHTHTVSLHTGVSPDWIWTVCVCVCVCVCYRWCGQTHTESAVPSISVTAWRDSAGRESPSSSATTTQRQYQNYNQNYNQNHYSYNNINIITSAIIPVTPGVPLSVIRPAALQSDSDRTTAPPGGHSHTLHSVSVLDV